MLQLSGAPIDGWVVGARGKAEDDGAYKVRNPFLVSFNFTTTTTTLFYSNSGSWVKMEILYAVVAAATALIALFDMGGFTPGVMRFMRRFLVGEQPPGS